MLGGAASTVTDTPCTDLENPYWATFNPSVEVSGRKSRASPTSSDFVLRTAQPWLAKPIEILRFNEL